MGVSQDRSLLQFVRRLATSPSHRKLSDGQLLLRFAVQHDEAAFEALLSRHAALVLGVCRRVLHDPHDAEDAFQAAFLVLARKAGSISKQESLGSWLHGVARRTALRVKGDAARRKARETNYAVRMLSVPATAMTWEEIAPILDEELDRMATKYRGPLVLCYLEGRTRDEAAENMGWSVRTLMRRLDEGRELLRQGLARRGITMAAALITTSLSASVASSCVPFILKDSTTRAAVLFATGNTVTAAVSANVATLAEGVTKAMYTTKSTIATVLLLAMIGFGLSSTLIQIRALEPPTKEEQTSSLQERSPLVVTNAASRLQPSTKEKLKIPVAISVDNVKKLHEVGELKRDAYSFEWVPGTNELAVLPLGGDEIKVFEGCELKPVRKFGAGKKIGAFAFSPDGEYLAWSENTCGFTIESLKTAKQVYFVAKEVGPRMAFSPDGKLVAAGTSNGIGLWEVTIAGKKIREIETDVGGGGLTPVFSPDGKTLVIGNRNSNPRLIETATGKLLHVLEKKCTQGIRFNPAGTILATANVDGSVGLWDVATGKLLKEEKAGEEIYDAEWSPKGDLLVTTGKKAKIIIWDTKELKPLRGLDAPEWVICVRFSPDGSRLFTAGGAYRKWESPDRKITIWGLEDPKP